ncbi:MAG: DUF2147 domain-containing protein [Polaribacter sp.]
MKKIILLLLITINYTVNSQTIFGKWHSFNDETQEIESVIEVYEKDGKAFAKIIEIKNPDRKTAVCDMCKGSNKDKPILGMEILSGLQMDDDEWSGGKILDPKNGKEYKCYIKLIEDNKLKIRGYVGFSLLGRTAYWQRAE